MIEGSVTDKLYHGCAIGCANGEKINWLWKRWSLLVANQWSIMDGAKKLENANKKKRKK